MWRGVVYPMDLGGAQVRACESFFPCCGSSVVRKARKRGQGRGEFAVEANLTIHAESFYEFVETELRMIPPHEFRNALNVMRHLDMRLQRPMRST